MKRKTINILAFRRAMVCRMSRGWFPTADKLALIAKLAASGSARHTGDKSLCIRVGFPRWRKRRTWPRAFGGVSGVAFFRACPECQGIRRASLPGPIPVRLSASDTSIARLNRTMNESLALLEEVSRAAPIRAWRDDSPPVFRPDSNCPSKAQFHKSARLVESFARTDPMARCDMRHRWRFSRSGGAGGRAS